MSTKKARTKKGRKSKKRPLLHQFMVERACRLADQIHGCCTTGMIDMEQSTVLQFGEICSSLVSGRLKPHMSMDVARALMKAVAPLPNNHAAVRAVENFCATRAPSVCDKMIAERSA